MEGQLSNTTIEREKGTFIRHDACPDCGSKDALGVYDDHSYCYSCQTHTPAEPGSQGDAPAAGPLADQGEAKRQDLLQATFQAIPARGLSEETCRKFGYGVTTHKGQPVQVATYRDKSGRPVAQKIRTADKRFSIIGDAKGMTLLGSHLWTKGKILTITEGEIDAMSASQVQGHKWATVSLPNGAASAAKAIKDNWEYIAGFDTVVLMFDQDEVGLRAAEAAAAVLPVGKAKIASLPCKDANECLQQGKGGEIINAIHQARDFRPDGIVAATDYREAVGVDDAASSVTYPYSLLNEVTRGLRKGELVTITAGSGIGKTTLVREIAHHLHVDGNRMGLIMLEESNKRTLQGLVGIFMSKNITIDRTEVDDDEITAAFDMLFGPDMPPLYLYDHFGSTDVELICNRIEYMVKALGVEWVILDHISILISGQSFGQNERTLIDMAMTKLRTLVQELNIGLMIVSHLRRPDGNTGHEDGAQVRLGQLRGSHSIAQLSDICISMSVDPDEPNSDIRHLNILKNRYTGQTGPAGTLNYNRDTGRLLEDVLAQLTPIEAEGEDEDA